MQNMSSPSEYKARHYEFIRCQDEGSTTAGWPIAAGCMASREHAASRTSLAASASRGGVPLKGPPVTFPSHAPLPRPLVSALSIHGRSEVEPRGTRRETDERK